MVRRNKSIPLIVQEKLLQKVFPGSKVKNFRGESLDWKGVLTPSPLSNTYKVWLVYERGMGIKTFVLEPKLALYPGKTLLPHVYSTSKQQLCLYYPDGTEWNSSLPIVNTIVPWACEWLLHYEIWLITGEWHGGGVHHESDLEKKYRKKP